MANVSQQVPNFLGGVSQASDIQKNANQLEDIINGFPDVTYGLVKRPGSQWLYGLNVGGTPEDYYWFTINSNGLPYLGCIGDETIRLWSTTTGVEQTINFDAKGTYLDEISNPTPIPGNIPAYEQFRVFTLEKGTVVLNNRVVTAKTDDKTPAGSPTEVSSFADLPDAPTENQIVHILNTPIAEDDYFVQWNGSAWVEIAEPDTNYKLDATTLPHGLIQTGANDWVFGPLQWEDRQVGNDKTNPFPSFVGLPIQCVFAYMNRIGFLAGSNVVMSQPLTPVNDVIGQVNKLNFFAESAFVVSEADPVDISVASIRDVVLYAVEPTRQGMVLFAPNEQFLLYSTDRVISPSTAMARSLSTWEINRHIPPVELDSEYFFVSGQAPLNEHSRLINMKVRGMEEDPICTDVSKVVSEWIPSEIFQLESSTQDQFISIIEREGDCLYFYRYFKQNGELAMTSWFKWKYETGSKIIHHAVVNSNVYVVLKTADNRTSVIFHTLASGVSNKVLDNNINSKPQPFLDIKPNMDFYARVESAAVVDGKTQLTMNADYPQLTADGVLPFLILAENDIPRSLQYQNIQAGYGVPLTWNSTASKYETTTNINLTADADKMVMGFLYRFEVALPTLYYRSEQTDYAARLNIARCKFECSAGLQGALSFQVRADGYTDFDATFEVTDADVYDANNIPLVKTRVFEVPINKQNRFYTLKAVSDSPFPIAMNSMTWEGTYSPRFYRRL